MNQPIGPLVGSGRVAEVFEYGDAVVKLYRDPNARSDAFIESATLAIVADHGLPTPRVFEAGRFQGRWGLVMERADGEPLARFAQGQPELVPDALEEMVSLHLRIHKRPELRLPPLKARLRRRLGQATQLPEDLREKLLAQLAGLPDGDRLCHGDFHPFNVVGLPGHSMVIDWLDATSGAPEADVCRSFVLMLPSVPELAENYLELYLARGRVARTSVLAWLQVVAGARLADRIPEEEELLLRLAGGNSH